MDDGSRDHTAEVLERYSGCVRVIRQKNSGVSAARNRGASEAHGDLVAFLDADDAWLPRKLELQLERLAAHPEVVASFTETLFVHEGSGLTRHVRYRNDADMVETLLVHGCVIGNNSSVVIRQATFVETGGFDTRLSQSADWDMWLRLAERGPFDLVAEPLVRYRVHDTSMSRNIPLLESDNRRVLEAFFDSPQRAGHSHLRRAAFAHNYAVLAGSYLHARAYRQAFRCLFTAAHYRPAALTHAVGLPPRAIARAISRRGQRETRTRM